MGNSIFGRVSNLVRANLNEILDSAEDPEVMLDQLVRDFVAGIQDATAAVASTVGDLRLTEEDLAEAQASAVEWGNKAKAASRAADSAVGATEKDRLNGLARIALTKQLSFEQEATRLQAKVDADTVVVNDLKSNLSKMELKLDTLRTKRSELLSRARTAQAQRTVQVATQAVNAADPTSELARFEERIRGEEAKVRGYAELESETIEEQFADLDRTAADIEVEQRLAALKETVPA